MCVKSKQLEQQAVSKGCVHVCVCMGVHCTNCLHKATLSEKKATIEMLLVLIILYLLALSLHFFTCFFFFARFDIKCNFN